MNEYEGKTLNGRFSIDRTMSIKGIKKPHHKQGDLECKNELICGNCVEKRKIAYFNGGVQRTCNIFLDIISERKRIY